MTKFEEIHNHTNCLNKATMEEPLFVLRAKDQLAPFVVRVWSMLARLLGVHDGKTNAAEALADNMVAWQKSHKSKIPD